MQIFLKRARSQAGVTLLEAMVSMSIMGIVASMAAANMTEARRVIQGDNAMRAVIAELNSARDMAVMQRRNMEVQFVGGNWVRVVRHEAPGIVTTVVRSVALEGNAVFALVPGVPDTPDAQIVMFGTDGTLIDGNGNPLNGTVFLAIANQPKSVRAVTVLGTTGRIRGYRWFGAAWNRI
jgi:prepilin-type N-terminal cleavage/methylation domain-containing protein